MQNYILRICAALAVFAIAACGGNSESKDGPSREVMMTACLDGGTLRRRVGSPSNDRICGCIINALDNANLTPDENQRAVSHWQAQASKSRGTTLPGSLANKFGGSEPLIHCF